MTASFAHNLLPPTSTPGRRKFQVGTTGWTADDLDDPQFAAQWQRGRYEIVEGVLTLMPPAYYDGALPLGRLQRVLIRHLDKQEIGGDFSPEVDFIVGRTRVARVDLLFMTPEDQRKQAEAHKSRPRPRPELRFGRIVVPPTLVVEAVSEGHELHDRETKRAWYAQVGVPNYWILDGFQKTLDCLALDGPDYRVDQSGRDAEELRPSLFPGLVIRLGELWV